MKLALSRKGFDSGAGDVPLRNTDRDGVLRADFLADLAPSAQIEEDRRYGPVGGRDARLSPIPRIDAKYRLWALIKAHAALLRGGAFLLVPRYLYHGITTRSPARGLRSCPSRLWRLGGIPPGRRRNHNTVAG